MWIVIDTARSFLEGKHGDYFFLCLSPFLLDHCKKLCHRERAVLQEVAVLVIMARRVTTSCAVCRCTSVELATICRS